MTDEPFIFRMKSEEKAALRVLAAERSTPKHTITMADVFREWLAADWESKHPGMCYPDNDGKIVSRETHLQEAPSGV